MFINDGNTSLRAVAFGPGPVPVLSKIEIPTVVVHGTDDVVVPIAAGRALQAGIRGAQMVELSGAGHAPAVTRPNEVSEAILSL